MSEEKVSENVVDNFLDNFKIKDLFNDGDNLPFGYYNPEFDPTGVLKWICANDASGKITSVYECKEKGQEIQKQVSYMTMEEAIETRRVLVESGWKKIVPPKITFTYPGRGEVDINRKEKRKIKRAIEKLTKNNPFN